MTGQDLVIDNKKMARGQNLQLCTIALVGEEGLEPSLSYENKILSLARLPIPPLALVFSL